MTDHDNDPDDRARDRDRDATVGTARRVWWIAMSAIVALVAAVIVVLELVRVGRLDALWAYVSVPLAIIAAATAGALTVLKASAESRRHD
jgi:hypothetical protein